MPDGRDESRLTINIPGVRSDEDNKLIALLDSFKRRESGNDVNEIRQLIELLGKPGVARDLIAGPRWQFNTMQADVLSFMHAMDQVVGESPALRDTVLRRWLIDQEYTEICKALDEDDLVEAVDGVIDMIYVCIGALCAWGVSMELFWNEVHRTNMLKSGHKKDDKGKVLKPAGWVPPRIDTILRAYGWEGEEG